MSIQLNCQNISFQAIHFIQTIPIQPIQFSISIDFVYTWLNVKTVLYKTFQFSVSRVSMSKTVKFQTVQFSISTQFNCQKHFISSYSVYSNSSNSKNPAKHKYIV